MSVPKNTLSIIIPAFNCESLICHCLEKTWAALESGGQAYFDTEIIVVDDCSTDRTRLCVDATIKRLRGPYSWHVLSTPVNSGAAVARQVGIDAAQGQWLFFVDADDYPLCSAFRIFGQTLQQYGPVDIIYGHSQIVPYDAALANAYNPARLGIKPFTRMPSILRRQHLALPETLHNKLISRQWWDSNSLHMPTLRCHEDVWWVLQTYNKLTAAACVTCGTPTYVYSQQPESVIHTRSIVEIETETANVLTDYLQGIDAADLQLTLYMCRVLRRLKANAAVYPELRPVKNALASALRSKAASNAAATLAVLQAAYTPPALERAAKTALLGARRLLHGNEP